MSVLVQGAHYEALTAPKRSVLLWAFDQSMPGIATL